MLTSFLLSFVIRLSEKKLNQTAKANFICAFHLLSGILYFFIKSKRSKNNIFRAFFFKETQMSFLSCLLSWHDFYLSLNSREDLENEKMSSRKNEKSFKFD
jgi:hypothetical protein